MTFTNKYSALQWRLRRRKELLIKLDRVLRQINKLEKEIQMIHGQDIDTSTTVHKNLYEVQTVAEA